LLLDCSWIPVGLPLDCCWIVLGLQLDCHWISAGLLLDRSWITVGLLLGCSWIAAWSRSREARPKTTLAGSSLEVVWVYRIKAIPQAFLRYS
jgi:hypothetical protein